MIFHRRFSSRILSIFANYILDLLGSFSVFKTFLDLTKFSIRLVSSTQFSFWASSQKSECLVQICNGDNILKQLFHSLHGLNVGWLNYTNILVPLNLPSKSCSKLQAQTSYLAIFFSFMGSGTASAKSMASSPAADSAEAERPELITKKVEQLDKVSIKMQTKARA